MITLEIDYNSTNGDVRIELQYKYNGDVVSVASGVAVSFHKDYLYAVKTVHINDLMAEVKAAERWITIVE